MKMDIRPLIHAEFREKDQVFAHKDDDGTMRVFLTGLMGRFAAKHARMLKGHITCARAKLEAGHVEHVIKNMGIERDRVDRLVDPWLHEPLVGIRWQENTVTLVDGNHRLVKLHELGETEYRVYIYEYGFWEHFLYHDSIGEKVLTSPSGVLENESRSA